MTERTGPTVLLAVEQLRRRVPGGIGAYAAACSVGLAAEAVEGEAVEVTLLASRAPRGAPPTRWPPSAGRSTRPGCPPGC